MEGRIKLDIGTKEAHDTGEQWSHLEVERSKVTISTVLRPVVMNTSLTRFWVTEGKTAHFMLLKDRHQSRRAVQSTNLTFSWWRLWISASDANMNEREAAGSNNGWSYLLHMTLWTYANQGTVLPCGEGSDTNRTTRSLSHHPVVEIGAHST